VSTDADLILSGGAVYTVDQRPSRASAVAVRDGVIVAVGSDEEIREHAGRKTELIDLDGRMLLPGFQDAHAHPSGGGLERNQCDLSAAHRRDDYLAIVATYAATHPDADWITGGGWSMDVFPGGVPIKADLDVVVPDRPVFLSNRDHHAAWVNSAALSRAGVTAATPDPADGRIERDLGGEPGGTLQEGAMELVQRVVPTPSRDEIAAGILEGQRYLHSFGITGWQEAIVGDYPVTPDCFEAYLALDAMGKLTGRVIGALWWDRTSGIGQIDHLLSRRERAASCSRFRATAVKFMQDGVCENFTAAMLTPYLDVHGHDTGHAGTSFFDPDELKEFVTRVDAEGFQAHFHAIGDRAVREVLDAVAAARTANGRSDNRHCAAHIQVVHPDDVPRFAATGLIANAQPLWACNEPQMTELTIPFLGPERAATQYPFASLLRSGARLAFGSDWPVSTPNPLAEMHVAVNRAEPPDHQYGGADPEPLLPDERIDVASAVAAFTMGSAYLNHADDVTGSITVGKRADLVVLDQDLFAIPPEEIGRLSVDATLVDGAVVYNRTP
jgi:predicted amidohydrolase YtcJ